MTTIMAWCTLVMAFLPPVALAILKSPSWRHAPLEKPGMVPLAFLAIYGVVLPVLLGIITLVLSFSSSWKPRQTWPAKLGTGVAMVYALYLFATWAAAR